MSSSKTSAQVAVDQLVAAGKLAEAAARLETILAIDGGDMAGWLMLAGLHRALQQPRKALDCVHKALVFAPLDFVALTMRAGLLERLEEPEAGEAWGEAIAQKPKAHLPPPLADAINAGTRFYKRWLETKEAKLTRAAMDAVSRANDDEAWRIARFRSNILRKTRVYHSEPTHFAYPGLTEREFHPRSKFPWLTQLEQETAVIREEALTLLKSRGLAEPYIQYEEREALAQWWALNHNHDWSAIHLLRQGEVVKANAVHAPKTMAALRAIGQRHVAGASPNAMFSLLAPDTQIPPHVGVDNTRLVCHLPLVVPSGCWFRVGAETRNWEEGQAFVFDDTIEHEALNPSQDLRIVLIFDVWHPDLSEVEREAVARLVSCEGTNSVL